MKNVQILLLVFLLGSVLSLLGCSSAGPSPEDITWVLEAFDCSEHGHFHTVMEDIEITALFDSSEGQVTGSGGCNHYFADYKIKKSEISIISPIGATEMYCAEPGVMDQEKQYFTLLETIEAFYISEGKLVITSGGDPVLVFVKQ